MIAEVRKWIFFVCTTVLIALAGLYGAPQQALAQTGPEYDFGGRVVFIFWCVNGLWVINSPPKPMSLVYIPGLSAIKRWGPPKGLMYAVLGSSIGYSACWIPCHWGLCPIGWGEVVVPNAGSSAVPSYMSA